MTSVAILGGGISGLSSAYYLARMAPTTTKIILIEGKQRLGGWIQSERVVAPDKSSVLFEAGPRSLRPQGATGAIVLEMIQHLKLNDKRLLTVPQNHPSAQHRYIYYDGQINTLPTSLSSLILNKPPILKSVLLAGILEPFRPSRFNRDGTPKDGQEDESLYSFMERRFNQHTAINLMGALAHGVYAGDIKKLSIQSTFGMLYEAEKNYGSVIVGMRKGAENTATMRERGMAVRARAHDPEWFARMEKMNLMGFQDGMETLPKQITNYLESCPNVEFITNDSVKSITPKNNGKEIKIKTNHSEFYTEHIISTLPSFELHKIIPQNELPHLNYNPSADVAVVNLAYASNIQLAYDGFGILTPHRDTQGGIPVPGTLGVIFDSNVFPGQDDRTKVTAMVGGADWKEAFGNTNIDVLDPQEAYAAARYAISTFLNIDDEPTHTKVHLQKQCIPQYLVGHQSRMRELDHSIRKKYSHLLSLTGASYMGVSVPDCIKNSRMLVEELLVSGALGSRENSVTGLGKASLNDLKESQRLSKGNSNVIMET